MLEDSFESEVSRTESATERSKQEMSFEKRPFEEALSQSDKGTMDGKYNARAFIDELMKETDDVGMKDGTMTTEKTEHTTIVKDDNGTKEENVEEDKIHTI